MQTPADDPQPRTVTVSIVSHGHGAMLGDLLAQLARHSGRWIGRVVLTLNLPETPSIDGTATGFEVQVLRNAQPQGFGANHNAAFAHCATPWFLVLNPDITLRDDAIGALLAAAAPDTGLLAPAALEPGHAKPQPHRALLTPLELLRRRLPGHRPPPTPAWVPGLFMLLRASAYRAVGGFDTRYFMYCEDVDLCLRLRLAGWSLVARDDVLVLHAAARASHVSPRAFGWHVRSLLRLWSSHAFREAARNPDGSAALTPRPPP